MFIKSNQILRIKLWNETRGLCQKYTDLEVMDRKINIWNDFEKSRPSRKYRKNNIWQIFFQAAAQAAQSSYLQGLPVGYPNFGATYPQGYIGYVIVHEEFWFHKSWKVVGFGGDDVDDENIAVVAAMMFVGA